MSDPILRALCWGGIILAAIIGALPIIQGLRRKKNQAPPEDHLDERNQAAAMLIATYPYRRRVQSIYNLLAKLTELEKLPHASMPENKDPGNT
jgi:hypothetical protein